MFIKRDEEDGDYQFLCEAENHTQADARVVGIGDIVETDEYIKRIFPLKLGGQAVRKDGKSGEGLRIKKFLQDGIGSVIEKDISDKKIVISDLYNNADIIYENSRNGTWFDWDMNGKTSPFIVCYDNKKRMGYISIWVHKNGNAGGYKWGNHGKGEAENIDLGNLSKEDTNYLINFLWQQEQYENIFDRSINDMNWETPVFLLDMDSADDLW